MKRKNFPRRKEQRRAEATARQEAYDRLSDVQKLEIAGKKQREKLLRK